MNNQNNKGFIRNPFLTILLLATLITGYQFFNAGSQVATQEISYTELVAALEDGMSKKLPSNPTIALLK